VAPSSTISVTFSEAVQSETVALGLTGPGGAVAGATAYDAATRTATFTPSAPLAGGTSFTVAASGAEDAAGNTMATSSWSFETSGACPCSLFASDATPAVVAVNESSSVNLGMRFTPSVDGAVSAIRFYKASTNTGTHIGTLWTTTGEQLASVTFTDETASGWQQATLDTPVDLTAGTAYVVSYLAPVGRYSATSFFFAQPFTSGPLQGLRGMFRYGNGTALPADSYQSANYWVDVVFTPA
jgi:hypothetical protein